jgi:hypothetical protein
VCNNQNTHQLELIHSAFEPYNVGWQNYDLSHKHTKNLQAT